MVQAYFRHGKPIMADYTPAAGDVSAGDIVLLGNTTGLTCGIAHNDISNTVLGALAVGGGVYKCQVASNYAAGTKVHKPSGNAILTSTATNNAQVGFTLEAAAAANAWVHVLHHPYVPT
jgi:predicted RecA/RadA family phage recombinase